MTPLYHPRPERWPQVSLKGLFVLVSLAGVVLGWLSVQVKWIHDRHEAIKWINGRWETETADAPWSIRILGEQGIAEFWIQPEWFNAWKPRLRELFPEAKIEREDEGDIVILDEPPRTFSRPPR